MRYLPTKLIQLVVVYRYCVYKLAVTYTHMHTHTSTIAKVTEPLAWKPKMIQPSMQEITRPVKTPTSMLPCYRDALLSVCGFVSLVGLFHLYFFLSALILA